MATAPTEIKVTPEIAAEHGLTGDEYSRVRKILGRDPNITELGIFSVMWSEHCSYKSSKVHLKRLPTRGKLVVQGPGENFVRAINRQIDLHMLGKRRQRDLEASRFFHGVRRSRDAVDTQAFAGHAAA